MQKSQKGFTLIELVVVIVLLGILGVTALGKFQNLSNEAQTAANQGVASELSAASNINYAAALIGTAGALTIDTATGCTDGTLTGLFSNNAMPTGYTLAGGATCTAAGDTYDCNVTETSSSAPAGVATIVCTAS